ncbi:MAG: IMP dehydrogenase [Chitinophagales bacterium]|nr:IMP dehydrogenase [Chitinophagales bacterium]MBP9548568.1 IMP dehydrogenase [Chitinophagales bacterium]
MENYSNKFRGTSLTFDDLLVVPAYSEVLPRDVDISTKLTRTLRINVPLISAAMDTVTEYRMAIAMAREGGIGIIHKNMPIASQAEQVRRVKRADSGMIIDPIILNQRAIIGDALQLMRENRIGGIPVVDDEGKLAGILTNRDLRFENNMERPVVEVMTSEKLITAPEGTTLQQAEEILKNHRIEKLPVVDANFMLKGLITYRDIMKLQSHPRACKDGFGRLLVGAAVGVTTDTLERIEALKNVSVDLIIIDTAHGHSKGVLEMVKLVKKTYPALQIIAGNIATGEGAKALVDAGVDGVKVGVGPGSICTTRVVAGVGVAQISAIYEAAKAIDGSGVPIIGDGGIRYTGDIVKAIVAGADSIMAGSLLAGSEESPGETIIYEGRKFKSYRGMGSVEAMEQGSKDRYFQDVEDDIKKLVPEGIVGRVPFKGTIEEVMVQYIGGLRAGMGYAGAKNIEELKKAQFVQITSSGIRESHPHDVVITKEAPNYSR